VHFADVATWSQPHIHLDDYTSGDGISYYYTENGPKALSTNPLNAGGIDQTGMVSDTWDPLIREELIVINSYPIAGENLKNHYNPNGHPDGYQNQNWFQYPDRHDYCIPDDGTEIDFVIFAKDTGPNDNRFGIAKIE